MPLRRTLSSIEAIASHIQYTRSVSAPSISPAPSVHDESQDSSTNRSFIVPELPRGALEERLLCLSRSFSDNVLLAKSPAAFNAHSLMTGHSIGDKVVSYLQHLFTHVMSRPCQLVSRPIPLVESMDSRAIGVYCVQTHACLAAVVIAAHGLTKRTEEFFDLLQRLRVYSGVHFPFGILTNGLQFQLYWLPDEIACSSSLSEAGGDRQQDDDDEDFDEEDEDDTLSDGYSISPDISNRNRKSIQVIEVADDSPESSRSSSAENSPSAPQLLDIDANVVAREREHQRALCSSTLSVIVHGRALSSLLCASLSLAFASNIGRCEVCQSHDSSNGPCQQHRSTQPHGDIISQLQEQCYHNMQSDGSEHLLLAICPSSHSGSASGSSRSLRPLHRTPEAFWVSVPRSSFDLSLQPPSSSRSLRRHLIYLLKDLHGGADGRVWLACSAKSGRLIVIKFLSSKTDRDKYGRLESPWQAAKRECSHWKEVGLQAWPLTLLGHQCVVMPFGLSLQLIRDTVLNEQSPFPVEKDVENKPVDNISSEDPPQRCGDDRAKPLTIAALDHRAAVATSREERLVFKFAHDATPAQASSSAAPPSMLTICGFRVHHMAEFQALCQTHPPMQALIDSVTLFSQRRLVHDDIEWRHVALFPQFKKRSLSSSLSSWWRSMQRSSTATEADSAGSAFSSSVGLSSHGNNNNSSSDVTGATSSKAKARLVRSIASFLDLTRVHRVDSIEEARYLMMTRIAGKLATQFPQ